MKDDLILLCEDENFRLMRKKALVHSVSQRESPVSAVSLYREQFGYSAEFKDGEEGLLYRLDYKTSGLLLFAKSQSVLCRMKSIAVKKIYRAFVSSVSDFPMGSFASERLEGMRRELDGHGNLNFCSYFRSFGRNGAAVRPVFEEDVNHFSGKKINRSLYSTFIEKVSDGFFRCTITRGARHQIRSTLASLRYPIDGDADYCSQVKTEDGAIRLECAGLEFAFGSRKYNFDLDSLLRCRAV